MSPRPERDLDRFWQPPKNEGKDNASQRISWINDVVGYGEQFQSSQFSSKDIGLGIDMISGRLSNKLNQSRSSLTINRGKRALRQVVANIANIRSVDAYTSDNPALQSFLGMCNKVWKAVYFESKFPRQFKKASQWLVTGGYSYVSPVYRNTQLSARSAKRIDFDVFNAADALPFQLPDDNEVQGAYAWTLMRFMPVFKAHALFPKFQSQLRPIARRRYSGNASKDRLALAERFRTAASGDNSTNQSNWAAQMCEIRYTYIRDLALNDTKKPIAMGSPGALESYIVPFLGQELPTAEFIQPGIRKTRKAQEEDCFLYPNLRLMISSRGMATPMYDDPAFDWHGMFPIARFSADEWPWEPGYSLARDIFSLLETRQHLMRGMDQTAKQRFDPALIYDKSSGLPRKTMESFDPYEERGRLGVDGEISDSTLRTALPPALLEIPAWGEIWDKKLTDEMDYILGLDEMQNLAKAKMNSANGDALQQAMEEAGPIVEDISHAAESPMADLMEMVLSDVIQYYPTGRVMQYVGPDGVSKEVFDLDPTSLVPSHDPSEDQSQGASIFTRMDRTKTFLANIHALITPGSLHGIVQTQDKLLKMQLQRAGFMISSETVAKALDIPNWGTLDGNTELEKWKSENIMKLEFAEKMKQLATSLESPAMAPPPVTPLAAVSGRPQPGRPPSGNRPPELKSKASAEGPRAVVSESG